MKFIVLAVTLMSAVLSSSAGALTLSNESIPYYPQDFYNRVHGGEKDADLVSDLHAIITKGHNPISYTQARQAIFEKLYLVQDGAGYGIREVYCGRVYNDADFTTGPKASPTTLPDDKLMNVEHTWPQSKFVRNYPKDTQKTDLHHLFPSDSKLNSIRGNFWFGEVEQQKQALKCGQSKFGTWNGGGQFFEPPNAHKGNVARALMYFSVRYDAQITSAEEALMKKWSQADPPDANEKNENDMIEKIQGNRNPFVDFPELVDQIADF